MSDRSPRVHLSLRVQPEKLASLLEFYTTLFGVGPRKRQLDYVQFDLVDPPLNFTLVPTRRAVTGEVDHLGIQVFSEAQLDDARRRLAAAGLPLREEHDVACCYARQDKFWLVDPEGREVEVFLKLADIDPAEAPAVTQAAACCAPECCADP